MKIESLKRKTWLLLLLLCASASAQQYVPALPGYRYHFPQDHFAHPDYRTEWWYYTGNLRTADGHRFGFELTFFRQGFSQQPAASPWFVHDLYMAHLALTDIGGKRYYSAERLNRAGPGIAGVDAAAGTVWNGNWQTILGDKAHRLRGFGDGFSIDLAATPRKPPVIHGENGVSQKAEGKGHASHYISFTRMTTSGAVQLKGKTYKVDGDTWMDHEFFSESSGSDEVGWDWLSLQLEDNTELMLYRLRHTDGSVDPYSSGSFVDAQGRVTHLAQGDFSMTPAGAAWKSSASGAAYPVAWSVSVPKLRLQFAVSTPLQTQEFLSRVGPSYWEGAIDVQGLRDDHPLHGEGYLEMTGYAAGRSQSMSTFPR